MAVLLCWPSWAFFSPRVTCTSARLSSRTPRTPRAARTTLGLSNNRLAALPPSLGALGLLANTSNALCFGLWVVGWAVFALYKYLRGSRVRRAAPELLRKH